MENKLKLVPSVYLYGGKIIDIDSLERAAGASDVDFAVNGAEMFTVNPEINGAESTAVNTSESGKTTAFDFSITEENNSLDTVAYCATLCHSGADELLIFDLSDDDAGHEANLNLMKDIADVVDIPILAGGNVKRLEDVKKYIYAGASRAILNMGVAANEAMIEEASARFGKDRIAVYAARMPKQEEVVRWAEQGAGLLILEQDAPATDAELPVLWMSNLQPEEFCEKYFMPSASSVDIEEGKTGRPEAGQTESSKKSEIDHLYGISLPVFRNTTTPLMQYKHQLAEAGLDVFLLKSPRPFSEFKTNSDGLIPVIVQDYQTNEVLMLAYMNEEAFNHTLACGRMTYYSRSRQELWEKGLTSGHFQYVKSLSIDCDDDTLLAKVYQVGAACHTGHRSCFYRDLVPGADQTNPLTVFDDVYRVILDRKEHPKEGSYTNYLFDKGIDKILKKVGEEATEIVIAAKNPDAKETVYEISDLLYHMMVLMAEKGISWKEVTTELARR